MDGQSEFVDYFRGRLSDVRFYSKALTADEVSWIANVGAPVYYPLESPVNIYDEEPEGSKIVNFRDFAILASEWLMSLE